VFVVWTIPSPWPRSRL